MRGLSLFMTARAGSGMLLAYPYPRALPIGEVGSAPLQATIGAQGWSPDDAASVLGSGSSGALSNASSLGLAPMSPPALLCPLVLWGGTEAVVLTADLWVFPLVSSGLLPLPVLAHAVPTSDASLFLPLEPGGGFVPTLTPPVGLTTLTPSGVDLTVSSIAWTLTGAPANGIYSSPRGVAPPVAAGAVPHVVTATSSTLSLALPVGALLAGYVYRVEAAAQLSAQWSYRSDVLPFWPTVGLTAAGVILPSLSRRLQPLQLPQYDASAVAGGIVSTLAYAPHVFSHAPPVAGSLLVLPSASGTALVDIFSLLSRGWVDADALAVPHRS